jgi:hypothetical protein
MKVIIAGGRDIKSEAVVLEAIMRAQVLDGFTITEVVSGGAKGVDRFGEQWALAVGLPVKWFHAEWEKHGTAAGPIRNRQMAEYAEALILVWDGKSRGSASMKREATKRGLKVSEFLVPK